MAEQASKRGVLQAAPDLVLWVALTSLLLERGLADEVLVVVYRVLLGDATVAMPLVARVLSERLLGHGQTFRPIQFPERHQAELRRPLGLRSLTTGSEILQLLSASPAGIRKARSNSLTGTHWKIAGCSAFSAGNSFRSCNVHLPRVVASRRAIPSVVGVAVLTLDEKFTGHSTSAASEDVSSSIFNFSASSGPASGSSICHMFR